MKDQERSSPPDKKNKQAVIWVELFLEEIIFDWNHVMFDWNIWKNKKNEGCKEDWRSLNVGISMLVIIDLTFGSCPLTIRHVNWNRKHSINNQTLWRK